MVKQDPNDEPASILLERIKTEKEKLIKEGKMGNDIVLSIDMNLQLEVEKLIDEQLYKTKNEANTEYYDHSSVII